MTYTKLDKYIETYKEDIFLQFLNNQHQEYRLSDFIDLNEEECDFFNI